MSEIKTTVHSTTPATYIYGEDLHVQHVQNRELIGSPHDALLEVDLYKLALDKIDGFTQYLVEEGAGFDPHSAQQVAEDAYGDEKRGRLADLRLSLVANGMKKVAMLDDEALGAWALKRYDDFMEAALSDTERLKQSKQRLFDRLSTAIAEEGLPLTREQLEDRLSIVTVGYFDQLKKDKDGAYNYYANNAVVDHRITGKELDLALFHELLHGVSGSRNILDKGEASVDFEEKRRGLEHGQHERASGTRLWLNEAVTDILANMLLDESGDYDFGSNTQSLADLGMSKGLKTRLAVDIREGYFREKRAALLAMKNVPASVLLRAYFAQDNDSFEDDPKAGIHAERDLQRAIKVAGGVQAVKELRLIDEYFMQGKDGKGLRAARKMHRRQRVVSKKTRQQRQQDVVNHTHQYQEQISRAKEYIKTR